ncbi:MAG: RIP metalloprotease RseP [Candidatus Thermofonsia Clade 1 bacterium]|jgi:regulator of sigma E protease|uniref:Zinc metalloprotease n=1 Tax=Candidatus Thermofonsia Clade 1 bacterium TaxID=2364210 RepID=A0A2M8PFM8_9CHLR|nr:MAG: RIP metalloprotease RseP [Candidatus Thermofonsia Clade 1 bacterium]RMF53037.1 MAG: RIP metalloprotease RseP [Chloroflexota bacterium]
MDFLLAVLSFVIVLTPLILIHEWGHFIACRLTGVTVLEFGLGFPPRAAKLFERNGTEFTLNWLPLGGFVRPLGEDFVRPVGEEATEREREAYRKYQEELAALGKKVPKLKSVAEATPLQRLFFLAAGSGMNVLAAVVLLIIAATISLPPVVLAVAPNSPAAASGLQFGDVITAVNGVPVSSTAQIEAQIEAHRNSEQRDQPIRLTVERKGEAREVVLGEQTGRFPNQAVLVTSVTRNMPADGIFEPDDIILSVDGRVRSAESIVEYVRERGGQEVTFVVLRGAERLTLTVVPRRVTANEPAVGIGLRPLEFDLFTGLALEDRSEGKPLFEAIGVGIQNTGAILGQLIRFPIDLIRGALTVEEARPVSVVGISQLGGQVVSAAVEDRSPLRLINFAALISLALGFTNLLPIPGLDGGRILFVLVELVRGKPMAPEREGFIHMVGLMFILGLFMLLVINDLVNPIGQVIR